MPWAGNVARVETTAGPVGDAVDPGALTGFSGGTITRSVALSGASWEILRELAHDLQCSRSDALRRLILKAHVDAIDTGG